MSYWVLTKPQAGLSWSVASHLNPSKDPSLVLSVLLPPRGTHGSTGPLKALNTVLSKPCGAVHEGMLPQGTLGCLRHPPTTPCSGPTAPLSHYSNFFPASLLYPPCLPEGPYSLCNTSSHPSSAPHPPISILTGPCHLPIKSICLKECGGHLTRLGEQTQEARHGRCTTVCLSPSPAS